NMGCPEKNVNKQGSGATLIGDPLNAQEIIRACKKSGLPVSVKTRIGLEHIDYHDWVCYILDTEPEALTIHGRTRKEMSLVPAHWNVIGEIVHLIKDKKQSDIIVIGNGDITSLGQAQDMAATYGVDGVMVGRGLFGNPWFFQGTTLLSKRTIEERLLGMIRHTQLCEELLLQYGHNQFHHVRKMYGSYLVGIPHAKQFKDQLGRVASPAEVMWTEFVSCEALLSTSTRSRERMLTTMKYLPQERPVVAQLFGCKVHQFEECAKIVRDLGFDGIDINMGCPEKNVNKQGSGATLIGDPLNAQ
ncbi:tRNA-dihydrouridine synthase, partial [Thraustotheca clavata]